MDTQPAQQPNRHGNADGDLVSFSFDPKLTLMHSASIGAFGVPDLDVTAEAGFSASATFDIAGGGTVDIANALAALDATECGIKSRTVLDLFGINFIPVLEAAANTEFPLPLELPDAATQDKCKKAFTDFIEVANRAKKAMRDAVELVRQ